MKIFGDLTEEERSKPEQIARMENLLLRTKKISKVNQAKGYVHIIYYWYAMGMEEEGNRLLKKIDEVCPEYFKKHLKIHMEKDEKYKELVANLFIEFAFLLTHKPEQYSTPRNS